MALTPGPGTVVVVVAEGTQQLGALDVLRHAPVRAAVDSDFFVALDAAGNPIRVPKTTLVFEAPEPDYEAVVDEFGDELVGEFGEASSI